MKQGAQKHGVFLIDKSAGRSSAAELNKLKWRLKLDKIGHAGTLDPFATGLLVALCGRATRCAQYATEGEKLYTGVIRFGLATDTDDCTGTTISTAYDAVPTLEDIRHASRSFVGTITQTPPQFSACKINGARAYDLARAGETVVIQPKTVVVRSFDILELQTPTDARFSVVCGPGTYIRALARDLGSTLGCGGALMSLRREASFPYAIKEALPVDAIAVSDMLPWWSLLGNSRRITLSSALVDALHRGDQRELGRAFIAATESFVHQDRNLDVENVVYCCEDDGTPSGILTVRCGTPALALSITGA
jgi:tRNA pseudouridine55 synthase